MRSPPNVYGEMAVISELLHPSMKQESIVVQIPRIRGDTNGFSAREGDIDFAKKRGLIK